MIKKKPVQSRRNVPVRRVETTSVWSLSQYLAHQHRHIIGSYSTEVLAGQQAAKIIAKDAGIPQVRLPAGAWTTLPSGAKELIYGRNAQSWRFVVEPWIVDGDA